MWIKNSPTRSSAGSSASCGSTPRRPRNSSTLREEKPRTSTSPCVEVLGFSSRSVDELRGRLGVLPQDALLPALDRVGEFLIHMARLQDMPHNKAIGAARDALREVGGLEWWDMRCSNLSHGMAKRVSLAQALLGDPDVVLLDEPTAGLDPQSRLALWGLIETMKHRGITVFLTTHYMEEADRLCDRVAIIDHGEILVTDTPEKLKRGVGAETIIDLTMDTPGEDLLERLRSLPGIVKAEPTPSGARLMAASADGLLVRVVEAAQGHTVRDIAVTEPTLETVFINLTGRDLRE